MKPAYRRQVLCIRNKNQVNSYLCLTYKRWFWKKVCRFVFSTFLTVLLLKINTELSIFVAWNHIFTLCFR